MLQLDKLGVLEHAQYISTVSGGSLAGLYYALNKNDPSRWNPQRVHQVMSINFERGILLSFLNPLRWRLGTSYDRTDALAELFNRQVFDGKTFSDLPYDDTAIPLINSTDYLLGRSFVFTDEEFDGLSSNLGEYPLGNAVAASAAFPGVFRAVTLRNFSTDRATPRNSFAREAMATPMNRGYLHLIDGGVYDNLGLATLRGAYDHFQVFHSSGGPYRCLMISVDASLPYDQNALGEKPDTRGLRDVGLDTNALGATSILMEAKASMELDQLGFSFIRDIEAIQDSNREGSSVMVRALTPSEMRNPSLAENVVLPGSGASCSIWHIALRDLGWTRGRLVERYFERYHKNYESPLGKSFSDFSQHLSNIPTRFKISAGDVKDLDVAAELIVQDPIAKEKICAWLMYTTGHTCRTGQ